MKRTVLSSLAFLFTLIVLSPTTSFVEDDINISRWIVNAILIQNGDLNISEDITFTLNGKPNGIYKNIILKKVNKIQNLSITELTNGKEIPYERVKTARSGDINKFILKQDKDNISLKIFSLSPNSKKTLRLKYTLKNVAKVHSDTAELYYKFLGNENKTHIDYFSVNLQLPGFDKDRMKIFIHGPAGGKIYFSDEIIKSEIRNIKNRESIENRILFPKEYIELSTNKGNSDFDSIAEEENTYLLKIEQIVKRKDLKKKDFFSFSTYLVLIEASIFSFMLCRFKKGTSILKNKTSL